MMLLATSLAVVASAQDSILTLEQSIELAKQRNGLIRSAYYRMLSSQSASKRAFGAFLPTITPRFSYDTSTTHTETGAFRGHAGDVRTNAEISASWQLLDNGSRLWSYEASKKNAEASMYGAISTLRSVLFQVNQQYMDALRAQEQLSVQQAQLKRAEVILDQTRTRVQVGDAAQKDILQASADALNAKASVLQAENAVATQQAGLKALIGWSPADAFPQLQHIANTDLPAVDYTLEQAFADGMKNRPDLLADHLDIDAQKYQLRLVRSDSWINYSLDATYRKQFANDPLRTSGLSLTATIPLYDGARSKENVRIEQLSLKSLEETLLQDERDARAEIESAYKTFDQNRIRLVATKAALEAAKVNYEAAADSQKQGAGDLIQVLTAQVSLTTAESNNIDATYDLLISAVQLKLVTGQPLPGQEDMAKLGK